MRGGHTSLGTSITCSVTRKSRGERTPSSNCSTISGTGTSKVGSNRASTIWSTVEWASGAVAHGATRAPPPPWPWAARCGVPRQPGPSSTTAAHAQAPLAAASSRAACTLHGAPARVTDETTLGHHTCVANSRSETRCGGCGGCGGCGCCGGCGADGAITNVCLSVHSHACIELAAEHLGV